MVNSSNRLSGRRAKKTSKLIKIMYMHLYQQSAPQTKYLCSIFLFLYIPYIIVQLELDIEQQTGFKSGKEYVKAIYGHSAYLTYMQSTSWEMLGWMKHKLGSRLPGEIWHHPYGRN